MYRKYTLTKTNVINAYHYLLQTQDNNTSTKAIFHQILISTTKNLPSIITQQKCMNIIQESQNQNLVAEDQHKFQVYIDNHLLQIRLKDKIGMINQISYLLSTKELLQIVIKFNLDLLLSAKQLFSDGNHQAQSLSNSNKFFYRFVCQQKQPSFIVLPFYEALKIHYYDLGYSNQLGNQNESAIQNEKSFGQISSVFHRNLSINSSNKFKVLKHKKVLTGKQNILEDKYYTEDETFLKYLNFLIIILKNQTIIQFFHELQKLNDSEIEDINVESLLNELQKIKAKRNDAMFNSLVGLVSESLKHYKEYTLNIFHKQCEILLQKYERMVMKKEGQHQSSNKGFISNLLSTKGFNNDKEKISKSCIIVNQSHKKPQLKSKFKETIKQPSQTLQKKLRYSKSLIDLKTSSKSNSKSRSLKKNDKLFAKSKDVLLNSKSTTNVFKSTWMSHLKNNHENQLSKFYQKSNNGNFGKSTLSSHWLAQSQQSNINQAQLINKLRGLKKKNIFLSKTITPQRRQSFDNYEDQSFTKSKIMNNDTSNCFMIQQKSQGDQINKQDLDKFQKLKNIKNIKKNKKKTEQNQNQNKMMDLKMLQDKQTNTQPSFNQHSNLTQHKSPNTKHKNVEFNSVQTQKQQKQQQQNNKNKQKNTQKQIKNNKKQTQKINSTKKQLKISKQMIQNKQHQQQINNYKKQQKQEIKQNITQLNKSNIKQRQIKLKKSTMIIPTLQEKDQIQNISLQHSKSSKQNKQKIIEKGQINKNRLDINDKDKDTFNIKEMNDKEKLNINQVNKQKQNRKQEYKKSTKINKKSIIIQSDTQRTFYIKHFQFLLKFYKENLAKITILPQSNILSYVINTLYFKILVQTKFTQSSNIYAQLMGLLTKKQQKIPLQIKKQSQMFTLQWQDVWNAARQFQIVQKQIKDNIFDSKIQQNIESKLNSIKYLSKISLQSSQVLQKILKDIYTFIYNNKIELLQKNNLTTLLQLCYLISITMIISLQKYLYYQLILQNRIHQLETCFKFKFQNSQDQYFKSYKKMLEGKNIAFMNIQEEYKNISNWVQGFK